jgi:hypothetical protein
VGIVLAVGWAQEVTMRSSVGQVMFAGLIALGQVACSGTPSQSTEGLQTAAPVMPQPPPGSEPSPPPILPTPTRTLCSLLDAVGCASVNLDGCVEIEGGCIYVFNDSSAIEADGPCEGCPQLY